MLRKAAILALLAFTCARLRAAETFVYQGACTEARIRTYDTPGGVMTIDQGKWIRNLNARLTPLDGGAKFAYFEVAEPHRRGYDEAGLIFWNPDRPDMGKIFRFETVATTDFDENEKDPLPALAGRLLVLPMKPAWPSLPGKSAVATPFGMVTVESTVAKTPDGGFNVTRRAEKIKTSLIDLFDYRDVFTIGPDGLIVRREVFVSYEQNKLLTKKEIVIDLRRKFEGRVGIGEFLNARSVASDVFDPGMTLERATAHENWLLAHDDYFPGLLDLARALREEMKNKNRLFRGLEKRTYFAGMTNYWLGLPEKAHEDAKLYPLFVFHRSTYGPEETARAVYAAAGAGGSEIVVAPHQSGEPSYDDMLTADRCFGLWKLLARSGHLKPERIAFVGLEQGGGPALILGTRFAASGLASDVVLVDSKITAEMAGRLRALTPEAARRLRLLVCAAPEYLEKLRAPDVVKTLSETGIGFESMDYDDTSPHLKTDAGVKILEWVRRQRAK